MCEYLAYNDSPSWESTPPEVYKTTQWTPESLSPRTCSSPPEDTIEHEQYTLDVLNEVSFQLSQLLTSPPSENWPARYRLPTWIHGPLPFWPTMTLETLSTSYLTHSQKWHTSSAYQASRTIFQEILIRISPQQIQNCLCLDIGSFSSEGPNRAPKRESAFSRLVAFESWVALIGEYQARKPVAYFQDTWFTALDIEFLTSRGHIVINSPSSADIITEDTFLYAPHAQDGSFCGTLCRAFPVLMLGVDIDNRWFEKGPVRRMILEFEKSRGWEDVALSALDVDWERVLGRVVPTEDMGTVPPSQDWEMVWPLYYRRG